MNNKYVIQIITALVVTLIGISLLLNPLYLYPNGGGSPEITYHVSQIEDEAMALQALALSEQVLDCPGERPCVVESQILEEGSVEYAGGISHEDSRRYPVVKFHPDVYIPEEEHSENTTILTLEQVSNLNAVEHVAVSVEKRPIEVQKAVETGSVTVYGESIETFERNEILEYEGEFYYQNRLQVNSNHWTEGQTLLGVRVILVALGSALIAYSGWRFRTIYL